MAANEKEITKKVVQQEKEPTCVFVRDEYDNEYRLEFTPRVVKSMERKGFKIDMDYLYSCVEDLFLGAFQANYGGKITPERVKKIWAIQSRKDELLGVLVQLYMVPLKELMAEPEGAEEGSTPTWKTA